MTTHGQIRNLGIWFRSLRENYLLDTPSPWLTFDAIAFLKLRLRDGIRVFEYGSGGSTLFWLQAGARCVSIEHDQAWYALVRQRLSAAAPIDYRLVPPELSGDDATLSDPADPDGYTTADSALARCVFRNYVTQIDEFPDQSFDIVLIDGRARPSCIKHSVGKVKAGGMLIVDNADLAYYLAHTQTFIAGWESKNFYGVGPIATSMWQTNVYIRLNGSNASTQLGTGRK